MSKLRLRFSLRAALLMMTVVCVYLASWQATRRYGMVAATAQRSPMPFIITEDGVPHFYRGASLRLRQERKYHVWFFGEPREIFVRELRREWTGQTRRQQVQIMKRIAGARREIIEQSRAQS